MSKKYGHTEPVSRIKERYPLGQLQRAEIAEEKAQLKARWMELRKMEEELEDVR